MYMVCLSYVVYLIIRRHTMCALVTGVQTCALPISIQDRSALLGLALGFNKAHLGPLGRHHNRLSIGCVVLLALHKWAHVAWRDQPDLMAKSAQHTGDRKSVV